MSLLRLAGAFLTVAVASTGLASAAPTYGTDYKPPKLSHLGRSSVPIAGSGTVIIKVLVKSDGSFQVQNVIRSTNSGDNAAALDIAKNSSYHVGTRGGQPATAFYDFTLRFKGKSVSSPDEGGAVASGAISTINSLLRAQNYTGAAAEFDKMSSIPARDRSVAGSVYATAAVQLHTSNAQQSLAYAQKAVSLSPSGASYFALGVAQLANNQNANAVASLKQAHDMGGGPKSSRDRAAVDQYLIQAYNATGDTADANAISAELQRIAPNTSSSGGVRVPPVFNQAVQSMQAGKYDDAVKLYEQAAQQDPTIAVTAYAQAALAIGKMDKPDFNRMKTEADRAVALNPNDPTANFAQGVALIQLSVSNNNRAQKNQGMDALNKADSEAKAAQNTQLSNAIENFIKSVPQ
ncbi:MAG: tetratricopeptide repeat protein [Candidatus Eremiobacteraeota bacterium]|nr:tetratricopeptide repeat protein [Candidatus Eremiobacteraeota bacterium]MBV9737162.1 tetratricopeptide repeat protein [Candidatus Eremiobacteraeota bacterium]